MIDRPSRHAHPSRTVMVAATACLLGVLFAFMVWTPSAQAQAQTFADVHEASGSTRCGGARRRGRSRRVRRRHVPPHEPITRLSSRPWRPARSMWRPAERRSSPTSLQRLVQRRRRRALRDGVVQGGASGLFLPAREISRQQAASLVTRAVAWRLSQGSDPAAVS
jgi:hypothetical protein